MHSLLHGSYAKVFASSSKVVELFFWHAILLALNIVKFVFKTSFGRLFEPFIVRLLTLYHPLNSIVQDFE